MAKTLSWTVDGLASEDGRFVIGVLHGLDGQPIEYFWESCPLLETKDVGERQVEHEHEDGTTTVVDREVVTDERPHGCATLDEMHDQAAAMNRSRSALDKFEAPRKAARLAATAARRQDAEDAQLDALAARLLARPGFEGLAARLAERDR